MLEPDKLGSQPLEQWSTYANTLSKCTKDDEAGGKDEVAYNANITQKLRDYINKDTNLSLSDAFTEDIFWAVEYLCEHT